MRHEIFAGSNFCDFPAIRKNKFPQIKIMAKIFPRIYSGVNILFFKSLVKNAVLRNHICSITTCLFRSENKAVYSEILTAHRIAVLFEIISNNTAIRCITYWSLCNSVDARTQLKRTYYQCWVVGTFWKSQKLIPSKKNQSVLIAKISSRKTQKSPIRKNKFLNSILVLVKQRFFNTTCRN